MEGIRNLGDMRINIFDHAITRNIALIQHITYDSFAEIDEKACKEII